LQGKNAAFEIFSWDNVTLSIQNDCPIKEKKIQGELQAILMDAMRIKDENKQNIKDAEAIKPAAKTTPKSLPEQSAPAPKPKKEQVPSRTTTETLRVNLDKELGTRSGVINIYHDKSWDPLIKKFIELNKILNTGEFKVAYLDIEQPSDFILIPDKPAVIITVDPKSPKDRLLQTLL
jgi:hypothetical protein